jgi:tRNA(adenine34) deaminase
MEASWFHRLMSEALVEARKGLSEGEVPIGAVVAAQDGRILGRGHNRPLALDDPTAHAEISALRRAGALVGNYRLTGTALVVTVEPCIMCMGAAIQARVGLLIYGSRDPKCGAAGSLYDFSGDRRLNHEVKVVSGILEEECRDLLVRFFKVRRKTASYEYSGEVPKWS